MTTCARTWLLAVLLACAPGRVSALSIQGTVADSAEIPVPDALVAVTSEVDPTLLYSDTTDPDGRFLLSWPITAVLETAAATPTQFQLFQNWPNPFNPRTRIGYSLNIGTPIELAVYNVLGQKVRVLDRGFREAGVYERSWDGRDDSGRPLSAGVYIYRLQAGDRQATQKMVMLDGAVGLSPAASAGRPGGAKPLAGGDESGAAPYTLEVTAAGFRGYRQEQLALVDGQTLAIAVERLPEGQGDLAVTETGTAGATTIAVGTRAVTIQLLTAAGAPGQAVGGVEALVEEVGGGSLVLLEDPHGALLPAVEFVGDDPTTGHLSVALLPGDESPEVWSILPLPDDFSLPEECLVGSMLLSQVVWSALENPSAHTVLFHHRASWDGDQPDPMVDLYASHGDRLLHIRFRGPASGPAGLDPATRSKASAVTVGSVSLGDLLDRTDLIYQTIDHVSALAADDFEIECLGQGEGELRVPVGSTIQVRGLVGGQDATVDPRTVFLTDNYRLTHFDNEATDRKGQLTLDRPGTVVVRARRFQDPRQRLVNCFRRSRNALTVHFVPEDIPLVYLQEAAASPAQPNPGERFELRLTIRNGGRVALQEPPALQVVDMASDQPITPAEGLPTGTLAAGTAGTFTFQAVLDTPGLHVLCARFGGEPTFGRTELQVRDRNSGAPLAIASAIDPVTRWPLAEGLSPLSVVLVGEESHDPEGSELTYAWDLTGDGEPECRRMNQRLTLVNEADRDEVYRVRLQVTDSALQAGHDELALVVHPNQRPEARFDIIPAHAAGATGTELTFDASASDDRETASAHLRYQWDLDGDGAYETDLSAGNRAVVHSFGQAGTRSVRLRVEDEQGNRDHLVRPFLVAANEQTITVDLPGGATMDMAWIEPGTFTMGSPASEPGRELHEGPLHEVIVGRGFHLGRYEITQGQWESVMGTQPWAGRSYVEPQPNHPAVYLSWYDVQGFIQRLNAAAGEALYRLPTEAEWEYACRAGTATTWSFGDSETGLGEHAWYDVNAWGAGIHHAQPVGTRRPNGWGLFDMHGNAFEWCQDWHGWYLAGGQLDPAGPADGTARVGRGGDFSAGAGRLRSAVRYGHAPELNTGASGARLLREGTGPKSDPALALSIAQIVVGGDPRENRVELRSAGTGQLHWTLSVSRELWLRVSAEQGDTGGDWTFSGTGDVTLTVHTGSNGLADGVYEGAICVKSNGGDAEIPVLMTVGDGSGPAPGDIIEVDLPGGATMELVWLQPRAFLMGAPLSERGRRSDEGPQHEVTLSRGFYLGKCEITQAQWESVMETTPWVGQTHVWTGPEYPAEPISWGDVQEFIRRLNAAEGKELYRLPTEAEWEYACRAGTTTPWSFGDDPERFGDYGWYSGNSSVAGAAKHSQPVGLKRPNPWGLFDMHGNALEWVQDWYGSGYYSSSPSIDPRGPETSHARVFRGGFFHEGPYAARSAWRGRRSSEHGASWGNGARLLRTGPGRRIGGAGRPSSSTRSLAPVW